MNLFGEGLHVTVEGDLANEEAKLRGSLEQAGIVVRALRRVDPTMEDVFFQLTGKPDGELVR